MLEYNDLHVDRKAKVQKTLQEKALAEIRRDFVTGLTKGFLEDWVRIVSEPLQQDKRFVASLDGSWFCWT